MPCSSFQYIDSSSMACTLVNTNKTDTQLQNGLIVKTSTGQVVPLHVGAFATARQLTHSSPLLLSIKVLWRNEEPVSVVVGNGDRIHANQIIWSNIAGGGSIESMSVTGGNIKLLIEDVGIVTGLVIDNGVIYFSTENSIMSLKTGETETETVLLTVLSAFRPMGLLMDGSLLFFSQESLIMCFDVNKPDGAASMVYQGSSGSRFDGLSIVSRPNELMTYDSAWLVFADYGIFNSILIINMNGKVINSIMSSSLILWPRGLACASDGSVVISSNYLGGLVRVTIDSGGNVLHLNTMASESYRVKTELENRLRHSGELIALTSLV